MATSIVPELSKKSKYYISKHRYYELKHFCLQYPEWQKELTELRERSVRTTSMIFQKREKHVEDTVSEIAIRIFSLDEKSKKVVQCCHEADPQLWSYIFKAVTEGRPYIYLATVLGMPCCKDTYYDRYRKFFYILSQE